MSRVCLLCAFLFSSVTFAQSPTTQATFAPATHPAASAETMAEDRVRSADTRKVMVKDGLFLTREEAERKVDEYFRQWLKENDPARKDGIEEEMRILLRTFGLERGDIYDALMVGGPTDPLHVALPDAIEDVQLNPAFTFKSSDPHLSRYEVVARRLNRNTFEVWTKNEGWLINAEGELLNKAIPPRKDGRGREWFGAFLPDGRWVTTDLYHHDKTLTFFSREGKWLREKKGNEILSGGVRKVFDEMGLIDWARSDAVGEGWIVRISNLGIAWVSPSGEVEPLRGAAPWSAAYRRELGPRGSRLHPIVPDDSGERLLMKESPGHGFGVLYPHYSLHTLPAEEELIDWSYSVFFDDKRDTQIFAVDLYGGTRSFGFWPDSTNIWINGREKSWCFDRTGKCLGIIAAERIADAADGQAMWFEAADGSIVRLDENLKGMERRRFVGANGDVEILALFDDIRAGIFKIGVKVVFARY